ncbi:MAG TPA: hypothetical protein VG146_18300 [Verrucomicrobiae bacterium]|nr:hypothetical protein [Verrucomicrobiae bacterium]
MKIKSIPKATTCLLAIALACMAAVSAVKAATPALQGQIVLRPVTPGDKTAYGLPGTLEVSGGITTVGVGTPVYLEAEINIAIPAADIVGVSWALTNTPVGSQAALTASPLGSNIPVYEPADRVVYQVAGRQLLRPDMAGQYTVLATITTASEGTTNVAVTITAGTYMGVNTCALCHSGGAIAKDMVQSWQTTAHSHIFTDGIDGLLGHYSSSCLQCHTVGYDSNTNAVNGGFDDVATQTGWVFPTVLTNGNFAAMPAALQNVANIQCENCHGPGSQHAYSLGNTNFITRTVASGDCNQCHDAPTHHIKGTEWYSSMHAITTRDPSGPGREGCVICHTANGFIARIEGQSVTNTAYAAIGCQTCHEPHGQTIPTNNVHLIRALTPVALMDGTVITNAGEGLLCMECHHARQNATTYAATAAGSPYFGPHHGPQADMLEGANGFTYGKAIPSSAHRDAVTNACVTCHMQTVASTDPTFLHAGGHTFLPAWDTATNSTDLTAACQGCHGTTITTTFDFPLQDYNGDGVIEGVQTEIQHLLDQLSTYLPPVGQVKSSLAIDSTWTRPQLEASYNWQFVKNDGSLGIHNTAYAAGLLKASIANLTGVSQPGGLPDAWVIQYFGSTTNLNALPNATPAGDGVPNWLKYALGLDPTKPGITIPGGVVWANGNSLINPIGGTNAVQIYTAAEVAFNTEAGKTYQIQSISSLSEGWQDVGAPIAGTGQAISYVTPTRQNVQQFYRVLTSP